MEHKGKWDLALRRIEAAARTGQMRLDLPALDLTSRLPKIGKLTNLAGSILSGKGS